MSRLENHAYEGGKEKKKKTLSPLRPIAGITSSKSPKGIVHTKLKTSKCFSHSSAVVLS